MVFEKKNLVEDFSIKLKKTRYSTIYMPQQVAPLKIKSSQKNACVKSLEMYAITPVTYHVTFKLFISRFKWHKNRTRDKASTMSRKFLALRFRVVWRIPLASISRGYKWIARPIPLFNSPNYKRFFYRLLIQHQYSEMLYKDSAFWGIKMTIINYIHHEAHLLVFIFWNCISHFE